MTSSIKVQKFAGGSAIAFVMGLALFISPATASEADTLAVRAAAEQMFVAMPSDYYTIKVVPAAKEIATGVPVVIDVREPNEFAIEHIRGSKNVPLGSLVKQIKAFHSDKTAPILVYCKSGHRGAMGLTVLRMLGYKNARSIYGGIVGWKTAGFPVTN